MIPNLMLVDDNPIDQKIYRRVIAKSSHVENLHQFTSPLDGLAFLRESGRPKVDVILLDIMMPGMNGFEFLEAAVEEFGEQFARIAIVMLTTSHAAQDIERARGFDVVKDYIEKPLHHEHLASIDAMLNGGGAPTGLFRHAAPSV